MRWEDLFADLERQWDGMAEGERRAETAERTRAEFAAVTLVERLRGSVGAGVGVRTTAGVDVRGTLVRVGADFVLLEPERHEVLVPLAAVGSVTGLGPQASSAGAVGLVASRLGLGSVLRRVAADRSVVELLSMDGRTRWGTLRRVGADFVELSEHGPDETVRQARDRAPTVVPFAAVTLLRRERPAG